MAKCFLEETVEPAIEDKTAIVRIWTSHSLRLLYQQRDNATLEKGLDGCRDGLSTTFNPPSNKRNILKHLIGIAVGAVYHRLFHRSPTNLELNFYSREYKEEAGTEDYPETPQNSPDLVKGIMTRSQSYWAQRQHKLVDILQRIGHAHLEPISPLELTP